jgi:hypothetical protein
MQLIKKLNVMKDADTDTEELLLIIIEPTS